MINRPFSTALARLGLVAAVLATLMILAPVVSAADPYEVSYAEDRTDAVATFSASDPDADAGDPEWDLSGPDADLLEISDDGELTFEKQPNFEKPADGDEDPDSSGDQGAGDNVYKVTVEALDGDLDVVVTVTNVDEPGSVDFDQLQAQETRDLEASFTDDDGKDAPSWQWSRGESAQGPWTEITGATSADRSPTADDVGNWLQATVSYTDSFGAKTVSGVIGPVVSETLSNAAPDYSRLDDDDDATGVQVEREVDENKKGDLGEPITATDANNDPRLYSLSGTDKDCFSYDEDSGQLSLSAERDYEMPLLACKTGGDARTEVSSGATVAENNVYTVTVTATDPSGATGVATVTVTVKDVNEAPEFTEAAKAKTQTTLYIDENIDNADSPPLALRTGEASTATAPVNYVAEDEDDNTALDADTAVRYSVEGADAKHFGFADNSTPTLTILAGEKLLGTTGADHEDKDSYSITIVATSGGIGSGADPDRDVAGVDRTRYGTLDVTIKVVDGEDDGDVEFPHVREPQAGKSVLAQLDDEDGGETGVKWQWYRFIGATPVNVDADTSLTCPDTAAPLATDGTVNTAAGYSLIDKADSATYTPGSAGFNHDAATEPAETPTPDVMYCLVATATYTDNIANPDDDASTTDLDESKDVAHGITERPVQIDDPANAAPKFDDDQDPSTPGKQAVAERSVMENAKDAKVGDPVVADDTDLLMYAVSDTVNFDVGNDGQITTKVELDYEALPDDAKYHMVELTATDPSGAVDTIMVKITVTDENDDAVIDAVTTGMTEFDYAEDRTDAVATFSASDPDADAGDPEWDLSGPDADLFEISDDGELTFEKQPNFEKPADGDEDPDSSGDQGAGDNVYKVTVEALDGDLDVVVTVTNVDEPGSVDFDQLQAQETRDLEASFTDDDGKDAPSWQWSRGESAQGPWTEITGATSADRSPTADDVGNWLQATVSYTDSFGAKTVSGVIGPVVSETLSNAAPDYSRLDDDDDATGVQVEREVDENKKGDLGEPITATDANNDPRLYSLSGTDKDCFSYDEDSGQLSLSAERDYEMPLLACKTGGDARTEVSSGATVAENNVYTVTVTATDPSGATGVATVTVTVKDVNEAPEFTEAAKAKTQTTLYIDENIDNADSPPLALRTGEASTATAPVNYVAEDEDDNTALDADTAVRYSVEGADAKHFGFADNSTPTLTILAGEKLLGTTGADHEDKDSYSITIVATSGGIGSGADPDRDVAGVDRTRYGTLDVTIKVVDGEDDGDVEFPHVREPQAGKSVLAQLDDEDGGETGVKWQWYRFIGATPVNVDADTSLTCPDTAAPLATDGTVNTAAGYSLIDKADSATYTPGSAGFNHDAATEPAETPTPDVMYCLVATATYTDNIANPDDDASTTDLDESKDVAHGITERPVQIDDPANAAPKFDDDQDPSTPGKQAVAERSVMENAKDAKVGDPVVADDTDLLMYAVSDTVNFDVGNDGQITTKVELDYEALPDDAKYHMVELTATDPSGAVDTIMVKITVTDENDDAVITFGPAVNTPPAFDGDTATRSVRENMAADTPVGDPVMATDEDSGQTLTYELSETMYFKIDDMGQISTTMMLDYEAMSTHMVTVTASDGEDTDEVVVTINVENAHTGCDTVGNMGLVNDCEALLDSKDALGGSLNWTDHTHTPMSDWTGVSMSGDPMRVTAVMLRDQGLDGTIPAALGRLSALTSLNLRSNSDLTGEIPASLGNLMYLEVLNLHSNSHTGEIPDLSGTSLTELYLPANDLSGSVPAWLNMMTDMTELWLWGNDLSGDLPDLSGMMSLDKLKLNGNADLTGIEAAKLPDGLRWLVAGQTDVGATMPDLSGTSLTTLWLNETGLEGQIPVSSIPTSVTSLNLKDNSLSGTIPDMSGLDNLVLLRLHRNDLSGDIPGTMGDMASIQRIWIYDNQLTGISAGLANASNLTHLYVAGNPFAEGTCLAGGLAMIENNDFADAGLEACAP